MKNLLDRLGSPNAISWVNFAVIFVLQMAGSTVSSLVNFSGRAFEFYSLRVFVLLCLIPVFLLGRMALNRFARTKPQPLITLATFAVAMLVTSFLFDYLLIVFEFTAEQQGLQRLTSVTFGFLATSILSSLLVTYAREFTKDNQQLLASAKALVETRSQASQRIADRKDELLESIRAQIYSALSRVKGQSASEDTLQMRALIDDVVRPISYDLARNVKADYVNTELGVESKVNWLEVNAHTFRGNPFHWIATSLALCAIIVGFLVSNFRFAGLLAVLGFGISFSVFALLARKMWPKLPEAWPMTARVMLFTFANAVIAVSVAPVITLISGFDLFVTSRMLAWMVICNLISWTVALVIGTIQLLQENKQALREAVDELKREVISLNGSYRQLQQGISRALHGPVQEAVTAALMKLQSQSETQNPESLVEELRSRIAKSLEVLVSPTPVVIDIAKSLEELRELWSDAVEITISLDKKDLRILDSQPWASGVLIELAREACSNAIRHGNATRIGIEIQTSSSTQYVTLRAQNNGRPLPEDPKYGLGSQLFDEVCLDWSRTQSDGEVLVLARVPLVDLST